MLHARLEPRRAEDAVSVIAISSLVSLQVGSRFDRKRRGIVVDHPTQRFGCDLMWMFWLKILVAWVQPQPAVSVQDQCLDM